MFCLPVKRYLKGCKRVQKQILQCSCTSSVFVGSSLLTCTYAKSEHCGCAESVEQESDYWNLILVGYAIHRHARAAMTLVTDVARCRDGMEHKASKAHCGRGTLAPFNIEISINHIGWIVVLQKVLTNTSAN